MAEVELRRQSPEVILLEAEFAAEFEQCCAVTLEPVRGTVSDRFSLVYGPAPEEEQEIALTSDEPAFEPLNGNSIDIGEAVAQELSLALPIFPRDPEARIDEAAMAEPSGRGLSQCWRGCGRMRNVEILFEPLAGSELRLIGGCIIVAAASVFG